MVDNTGIKPSQIFGWESEPKTERKSIVIASEARAQGSSTQVPPGGPADWETRRQAPNQRDQSLSFVAVDWSKKFAPAQRPSNLCAMYPRVANRLALCWPDAALTLHVLEGLLVDKRGGRKGFPAPVAQELIQLRRIRSLAGDAPSPGQSPAVEGAARTVRPDDRCR